MDLYLVDKEKLSYLLGYLRGKGNLLRFNLKLVNVIPRKTIYMGRSDTLSTYYLCISIYISLSTIFVISRDKSDMTYRREGVLTLQEFLPCTGQEVIEKSWIVSRTT